MIARFHRACRKSPALPAAAALLAWALSALAGGAPEKSPATMPAELRIHQTKYYVIHTDLDGRTVNEAAARLTAEAEEYYDRARGFAREAPAPMPFFLFADARGYHAAGGPPGTVGMFGPGGLLAVAARDGEPEWRVCQHEALHQLAYHTIGGQLPVWLNEGLAEYFAEGVWTGDGFVTGLVPPGRLQRLQELIRKDELLPFERFMLMTPADWTAEISRRNYDQAWSMVHFLIMGEAGRHQQAFARFVKDLAAGRLREVAFRARFDGDPGAFQKSCCRWWLSLDRRACTERAALAMVQTLTSYLARACAQGQEFTDAEAFLAAAREGRLACGEDRLPESLLAEALGRADETAGAWTIASTPRGSLTLACENGPTFIGTFQIAGGRIEKVAVAVSRPAVAASRPAPQSQPGR